MLTEQIVKAVKALRTLAEADRGAGDLLNDEDDIRLQFGFKKIPNMTNSKLVKITLPHSIITDDMDICLFVGDSDKRDRSNIDETIAQYEAKLKFMGITQITEIIPILKLKLEYQPYEAKRNLAQRFDLFLADDRIVRLLPSYLGKAFYGRKKHPVQVCLSDKRMERELRKALTQTRCVIAGKGHLNCVTVARLSQTDSELEGNISAAVSRIIETIPGGPSNLRSMHLKCRKYPALPLFVDLEKRTDTNVPDVEKTAVITEPEEVATISGKVQVAKDGAISIIKRNGTIKHIRPQQGLKEDSEEVKVLIRGVKKTKRRVSGKKKAFIPPKAKMATGDRTPKPMKSNTKSGPSDKASPGQLATKRASNMVAMSGRKKSKAE